jgi:hypothetical protein
MQAKRGFENRNHYFQAKISYYGITDVYIFKIYSKRWDFLYPISPIENKYFPAYVGSDQLIA